MSESLNASVYDRTVGFFDQLLQLLHPFVPFITEDIYHLLKERVEGDDICVSRFLPVGEPDTALLAEGEFLKKVITDIRNIKTKSGYGAFEIYITNEQYSKLFPLIQKNTKIRVLYAPAAPDHAINIVIGDEKMFIKNGKAGRYEQSKTGAFKGSRISKGVSEYGQQEIGE